MCSPFFYFLFFLFICPVPATSCEALQQEVEGLNQTLQLLEIHLAVAFLTENFDFEGDNRQVVDERLLHHLVDQHLCRISPLHQSAWSMQGPAWQQVNTLIRIKGRASLQPALTMRPRTELSIKAVAEFDPAAWDRKKPAEPPLPPRPTPGPRVAPRTDLGPVNLVGRPSLGGPSSSSNLPSSSLYATGGAGGGSMAVQPNTPPKKATFGQDLDTVPLSSASSTSPRGGEVTVPVIVAQCIAYLSRYPREEGLYRLCGSLGQIRSLKDAFDRGDPEGVDLSPCKDPHVVAGLLKLWFRELPAPLGVLTNDSVNLVALREEVSVMSPLARDTLEFLVRHLVTIAGESEVNKMSVGNLGVCFCPTLGLTPTVFQTLLTHTNDIFQ